MSIQSKALLDDGLLDVMSVRDLDIMDFGPLVKEIMNRDAEDNRSKTPGNVCICPFCEETWTDCK